MRHTGKVKLSARTEYAIRAALELAAHPDTPRTTESIASAQAIPLSFLENILVDLRRRGLVVSQRGRDGGHQLAMPANEIAIADIMRAEIGNLADVRGMRPENMEYEGSAENLTQVWVAARASYRLVLENITLADVLAGKFPAHVRKLLEQPDTWKSHWPTEPKD